MISTTKRRVLIIVLAIFAMFMTFASGLTYAFANQNTVLEQINFTMINGAQIRLDGQKGMRFAAEISKSDYQKIENAYETLEYGVFIMPKYYVTNYGALNKENTIDAGKYVWSTDDKIYENPTVVEGGKTKYRIIHMESMAIENTDTYLVCGSVHSIKEENLATEYTACAYIKATTNGKVEYKFAEEHQGARSFVEVAFRALNAEIYNDENDPDGKNRQALGELKEYFESLYGNETFDCKIKYVDIKSGQTVLEETTTGEMNSPVSYKNKVPNGYILAQSNNLPSDADARIYAADKELTVYVRRQIDLCEETKLSYVGVIDKGQKTLKLPDEVACESISEFKLNGTSISVTYDNETNTVHFTASQIASLSSSSAEISFLTEYVDCTATVAVADSSQIMRTASDVNTKLSRAISNTETRTVYLDADIDGAVIENLADYIVTTTNIYGLGHKLTNLTVKGEGLFGQFGQGELRDVVLQVTTFEPDWYESKGRYTGSDVLGGDLLNLVIDNVYLKIEYETNSDTTVIDTCYSGNIKITNSIFDIGEGQTIRSDNWGNAHGNDDYSSLLLMDENFFTTYANGLPSSFENSSFEIVEDELYFNGSPVLEDEEPVIPEEPEVTASYYTGDTSTIYYGNTGANKGNINGLIVSLTDGDVFTYATPIDFSDKTKDDVIRLYVLPKTKGIADVKNFFVRFTDVQDPSNYVEIRLMANYDDPNEANNLALYSSAKASNQKDFVGVRAPDAGSVYKDVMVVRQGGYGSYMASLTAKNGYGGNSRFSAPFEYSLDYTSKKIYGYKYDTNLVGEKLVSDLDNSSYYGANVWTGFQTGKAYVSVYSTDVIGESFDFVITEFFGENLNVENGSTDRDSTHKIIIPENADGNERTAAHELQRFIEEATGKKLPIIRDNVERQTGVKYFSVGNTTLASNVNTAGLKDSGYIIKTIGDVIYLLGPTSQGTSNAVYGYLNEAYDFEYYFTEIYDLTKKDDVVFGSYSLTVEPDIDKVVEPNVGFVQQNSINRQRFGVYSNNQVFIPANGSTGVHNLWSIMPESVRNAHPNWLSTDGQTACFNARSYNGTEYNAMQNYFLEVVKQGLKESSAKIFLISQPDNESFCTCSACRSFTYSSDVLLRFCNDLVVKVYDWFDTAEGESYARDFKIYFLAYHSTRVPNYKVQFNENVGVYVALDGYRASYGMNHSINRDFNNWITKWKNNSNGNVGYWLYDCNFEEYAYPYDTSIYKQDYYTSISGAEFVNEQGQFQHDKNAMTWGNYKNYISNKLRWNTAADVETLTENFFKACYKDAWDEMLAVYNAELTYWAGLRQTYSSIYSTGFADLSNIFGKIDTSTYWNKSDVLAWYNGFNNALTQIQPLANTDKLTYDRVYSMICAEIISPMTMLIELHGYKTNTEFVAKFKQYVTDSGIRFPWDGTGDGIDYWYGTLGI